MMARDPHRESRFEVFFSCYEKTPKVEVARINIKIMGVLGDEHMNGAAKKKRKVVVGKKVTMTVVEKEKRKVYVSMMRNSVINNYILLVTSPLFLRWRRFLLRRERKSKEDNPYVALVHGKRSSRVGIFSMVDVLGDEDYSWRKEGADPEDLLRIYRKFSKFVTVVDHSDHFFSAESSAMNHHRKPGLTRYTKSGGFLLRTCEKDICEGFDDRVDSFYNGCNYGKPRESVQNGLFFFLMCASRSTYPVSHTENAILQYQKIETLFAAFVRSAQKSLDLFRNSFWSDCLFKSGVQQLWTLYPGKQTANLF
ncbi:hypothetical protein Tco_0186476 [Tanacetum coccineum]